MYAKFHLCPKFNYLTRSICGSLKAPKILNIMNKYVDRIDYHSVYNITPLMNDRKLKSFHCFQYLYNYTSRGNFGNFINVEMVMKYLQNTDGRRVGTVKTTELYPAQIPASMDREVHIFQTFPESEFDNQELIGLPYNIYNHNDNLALEKFIVTLLNSCYNFEGYESVSNYDTHDLIKKSLDYRFVDSQLLNTFYNSTTHLYNDRYLDVTKLMEKMKFKEDDIITRLPHGTDEHDIFSRPYNNHNIFLTEDIVSEYNSKKIIDLCNHRRAIYNILLGQLYLKS